MERRRTFKINKINKKNKTATKNNNKKQQQQQQTANNWDKPKQNENIQTSEQRIHYTRPIKYSKKFSFGKIQHLMIDKFTPLSATEEQLSYQHWKLEKNLINVHFKCWLRLIPFSQCSPLYPEGHKHRYPLNVNPDWQVALFWHWGLLSQAFWRTKTQWNEITKERLRVWVKEGTKYRVIECTRICINIDIVFELFQGDNYEKSIGNSPSSHDNKTWHQLSSHCHISDAWRY